MFGVLELWTNRQRHNMCDECADDKVSACECAQCQPTPFRPHHYMDSYKLRSRLPTSQHAGFAIICILVHWTRFSSCVCKCVEASTIIIVAPNLYVFKTHARKLAGGFEYGILLRDIEILWYIFKIMDTKTQNVL